MLRNTPNNETIIVEYGFADSVGDDVSQLKNNWEELAESVVKSLAEYIGVPYVPVFSENTYIVKSGDTLWSIARNNGLTVNELKALNNLTSNSLSIGQVLKLNDSQASNGDVYVVKSGDTLYAIANKYGMTVDELKSLNNLISNSLSIGQILKVNSGTSNSNDVNYYTVVSGDSLYVIANRFNTTVDELKRINNLSSNLLSIGQKLIIPDTTSSTYQTYIVKRGDTLYSIARQFNTNVTTLQSINNLSTSNLSIGQQLLVL